MDTIGHLYEEMGFFVAQRSTDDPCIGHEGPTCGQEINDSNNRQSLYSFTPGTREGKGRVQ